MVYSLLVALLGLALAAVLRTRLVYWIAAICWVQNLVLPWWYTQQWIAEGEARALIVLKDLLLLLLFAYVAWRGRWVWRWSAPAPLRWILAFGAWAVIRVALGVALGEPLFAQLRLVRSILFPVEVVVAAFLVALLAPRIPARFERFVVVGLTVCAAVSLLVHFLPSDTFWLNDVNIAQYNVNVKGDPEWTVLGDLGISGSGAGRSLFQGLSPFRLIGTFGDPLTAGMVLGLAALALAARPRLGPWRVATATLLAAALFVTFSRSAWVFVGVGVGYLSIVQKRPLRLAILVVGAAALWFGVPALRQFAVSSVAAFAIESGDVYHAAGLLNFYSTAMLRPVYLLGTGPLDTSAQSWVLESGLAYLMVQFGLPLLVTFVGFCLSAERYLRRRATPEDVIGRLGAALALASLVVANFSFYALSFTAYFTTWAIVGLAIGARHRAEIEAELAAEPEPGWVPTGAGAGAGP